MNNNNIFENLISLDEITESEFEMMVIEAEKQYETGEVYSVDEAFALLENQ